MNARAHAIAWQNEAAHYAAQARLSRDQEHAAQGEAEPGTERAAYAWQAVHCQMLASKAANQARNWLTEA